MRMEDDEQPVLSNLDCFRRDQFQRRKQRDLHTHIFELLFLHGSKSRIFHCSAASAPDDGLSQRFAGLGDPDATLQMPAHVKGNEYAAALREGSFTRNEGREFPPGNRIHHGIAR